MAAPRLPDNWELVPPPVWRGGMRHQRAWVRLPRDSRLRLWLSAGGQLTALQLYANGYSPAQIGPLVGLLAVGTGAGALALLHEAARWLGMSTVARAAAEARRRGLIE